MIQYGCSLVPAPLHRGEGPGDIRKQCSCKWIALGGVVLNVFHHLFV